MGKLIFICRYSLLGGHIDLFLVAPQAPRMPLADLCSIGICRKASIWLDSEPADSLLAWRRTGRTSAFIRVLKRWLLVTLGQPPAKLSSSAILRHSRKADMMTKRTHLETQPLLGTGEKYTKSHSMNVGMCLTRRYLGRTKRSVAS
jgi:hypothetical protein